MSDRARMLFYEGQFIGLAGNAGDQAAIEHAHCAIDGVINALLRIQGAEEVSKFAFALCDRVVGKINAPTELPVPQIIAAPAEQHPPQPRKESWLAIWIVGFIAGAIVGSGL